MSEKFKASDQMFVARDGKEGMRHPHFEPWLCFNDKPGSPVIFFKSTLNQNRLAKQLAQARPDLYYWPERPENMFIVVPKGGYARIPHSCSTVHTSDDSPATYSIRSENQL